MNKTFKLTSLIAAMAMLCFASASASAGIISFGFTNDGFIGGVDNSCGAGCVLLTSAGIASATGGSGETWLFNGQMKVYEGADLGFGAGPGLGWSFTDLDGNNNLYGSFTALGDLFSWGGASDVYYTVLGGSGLFSGAVGTGHSTIWTSIFEFWGLNGGTFHEEGAMTIWTPTTAAVPEPAVSTLLIAGLGIVGFMAYRRRRAKTQI